MTRCSEAGSCQYCALSQTLLNEGDAISADNGGTSCACSVGQCFRLYQFQVERTEAHLPAAGAKQCCQHKHHEQTCVTAVS